MYFVVDVFAADIMAHNNCLKSYLQTFSCLHESLNDLQDEDIQSNSEVMEAINDFCSKLNLDSCGYELPKCRDDINSKIENQK